MIYIRKSVFETNSSSSHSIVITKESHPTKTIENSNMIDGDWHVDKDGIMDFWYEPDLQFGRSPFELLTDWYGRLRYAIASYSNDKDRLKDIEKICQRRIAGFVKFKFKKDRWDNQEYHGYVDHQSIGLLQAALKKHNISLEDFIFNDKYIVVIDGDEYCVFDTLIKTDLFNNNAVEDITLACFEFEKSYWEENNKKDNKE